MKFYTAQMKAFKYLEREIKAAGERGISKLLLIYTTTLEYEVSEKAIVRRLGLMSEEELIREDKEGLLFWIKD